MISLLILEESGRVNHAILKEEVPVRLDVLCVQQSYLLFRSASQLIVDFRIRTRSV